jgi:hypothetical protein
MKKGEHNWAVVLGDLALVRVDDRAYLNHTYSKAAAVIAI